MHFISETATLNPDISGVKKTTNKNKNNNNKTPTF